MAVTRPKSIQKRFAALDAALRVRPEHGELRRDGHHRSSGRTAVHAAQGQRRPQVVVLPRHDDGGGARVQTRRRFFRA